MIQDFDIEDEIETWRDRQFAFHMGDELPAYNDDECINQKEELREKEWNNVEIVKPWWMGGPGKRTAGGVTIAQRREILLKRKRTRNEKTI